MSSANRERTPGRQMIVFSPRSIGACNARSLRPRWNWHLSYSRCLGVETSSVSRRGLEAQRAILDSKRGEWKRYLGSTYRAPRHMQAFVALLQLGLTRGNHSAGDIGHKRELSTHQSLRSGGSGSLLAVHLSRGRFQHPAAPQILRRRNHVLLERFVIPPHFYSRQELS